MKNVNTTRLNEPKRHHYIPQFIIKNFADNELGFVNYCDKKSGKIRKMPTEEIFMRRDLYRDEVNNPNDPVKIEKDFAKYEFEIAKIINEKILNNDKISLSVEENDSLILFLALLHYRSEHWYKIMNKIENERSDNIFASYIKNENYIDFWRRNLGHLVNCRSVKEVVNHPNIDDPFKVYIGMDTFGLLGRYLVFADRRGEEDFFLSDAYPLYINGEGDNGVSFPLMTVFPISPKRMIISVVRGVKATPLQVRMFEKSFFSEPFLLKDGKTYQFTIRKMYKNEVNTINDGIYNQAKEGFAFIDEERFLVVDRNS